MTLGELYGEMGFHQVYRKAVIYGMHVWIRNTAKSRYMQHQLLRMTHADFNMSELSVSYGSFLCERVPFPSASRSYLTCQTNFVLEFPDYPLPFKS
jgi:hypothetical protein